MPDEIFENCTVSYYSRIYGAKDADRNPTARACRHCPDLGLFQGWPSRPLLDSYRGTIFLPFLSVLTAPGAPHSTLVQSSICDDAPERALYITGKKKNPCTV